jgi:hypothetical protein
MVPPPGARMSQPHGHVHTTKLTSLAALPGGFHLPAPLSGRRAPAATMAAQLLAASHAVATVEQRCNAF